MSDIFPRLVATDWLADHLGEPGLVVLDASRHLPAANRDPRTEYQAGHIPGARFLDLASLTDALSPIPTALPSAAQLAERLGDLGVAPRDRIVIYDDSAVKTAARGWFTLVAHEIEHVAILDGGLTKWRAERRPLESGTPAFARTAAATLPAARNVRCKSEILAILAGQSEQLLDARSADRVFGSGIDPVHGGQNGRIPGSLNLPFGNLYNDDGTFRSPAELRAAFGAAGLDLARPIVTTCGSGVTACVLLFALGLVGARDTALYDGSWQEWEADPETPKAQGPE